MMLHIIVLHKLLLCKRIHEKTLTPKAPLLLSPLLVVHPGMRVGLALVAMVRAGASAVVLRPVVVARPRSWWRGEVLLALHPILVLLCVVPSAVMLVASRAVMRKVSLAVRIRKDGRS